VWCPDVMDQYFGSQYKRRPKKAAAGPKAD
jgi:hypothetical protein